MNVDSKTLVMGILSSDAFTMVNKKILRSFDGDGTLAIVLCELVNIYKYSVANNQIDALGNFPLPISFLQRTMNLSSYKQQRALSTLEGGGLIIVSKIGMPSTRHVSLDFDAIAKLLLQEEKTSHTDYYKNLSKAETLHEFIKALDKTKDPLRNVMIQVYLKLKDEGGVQDWNPRSVGQLKYIIKYYSRKDVAFDYAYIIDLLLSTEGNSVSSRTLAMMKQYKRILQRDPKDRVYSFKEELLG